MRHLLYCLIAGVVMLAANANWALAQPLYSTPTYYAVDGVDADDVLNIRAAPNGSAEIIGSFAYDASPVEVVTNEGGWAYVSSGERMGWVFSAFLREIELPMMAGGTLPEGLVCSGTEPFWGMGLSEAGISFDRMDIEEASFDLSVVDNFAGVGPSKSFVIAEGGGQSLMAVVSNEMCSDGMSDRDYARRIDMVLYRPEGPVGYSGCCSMPLN